MDRLMLLLAAANGFVSVAMGAFAAHGLQSRLDEKALGWIETASRYQMVHAAVMIGVVLLGLHRPDNTALNVSAWAFFVGMLLFAGLLYVMGLTGWRGLGALVPVGGAALLIGWAALAWAALSWRP